jgi:hypothetical protein
MGSTISVEPKHVRFDNVNHFDPNYVLITNFSTEELQTINKEPKTYIKDIKLLKQMYIFTLPDKLNGLDVDEEE